MNVCHSDLAHARNNDRRPLQGMEASKLHVAHLENTIKELQEGAEKATRTAESAVVGTEERSTMVHDEPAEIASRAHAPATGLQNGQGMKTMRACFRSS